MEVLQSGSPGRSDGVESIGASLQATPRGDGGRRQAHVAEQDASECDHVSGDGALEMEHPDDHVPSRCLEQR